MPRQKYILGIVIPYYNTKQYMDQLLKALDKQVTKDIQVVIVDDGSKEEYTTEYEWATVIRQENKGASAARNTALDNIKAQYVTFIDSDDMVPDYYIEKILDKIKTEKFDYCYMSWTSLGRWKYQKIIKDVNDKYEVWNVCVWCRVYKWSIVKDIRFNEKKLIAEDAEYIRDAERKCKKKSFISDIMYLYNSSTPNSLTKEFNEGNLNTKRLVYHFPKITRSMDYLIDEVKEAYKDSEVIILTNHNEIPELEDYAMVMPPVQMKGTEFRGVPTKLYTQLRLPTKTQVVIWTDKTFAIGGIETFIYNFCKTFCDKYDIIVLYNSIDVYQKGRLEEYVQVKKLDPHEKIICDTIIINRITDRIPDNVVYKQSIQMVHCCKLMKTWTVPTNRDRIFPVSKVVKTSYPELENPKVEPIHNFVNVNEKRKALRLLSATRLTFEKGEDRMIKLAKSLQDHDIPFVWTIFTERPLKQTVDGMVYMKPTLDIQAYVQSSDYVVQLSDSEGFCYSIVEALQLGVPVITTPIDVLDEIGFKDKENGFIIPFDLDDFDPTEIYKANLDFKYDYDNESIMNRWIEILGNTIPTGDYKKKKNKIVNIIITHPYYSIELGKKVNPGETYEVDMIRAEKLLGLKLCRIKED